MSVKLDQFNFGGDIFRRTGTNEWNDVTKLYASDAQVNNYFGHEVSVSGGYIVIFANHGPT